MTYWIITTEYPPFHGGGISTYNYHTARMLTERNVKVTIFVSDYHLNIPVERDETTKNLTIIRFKPAIKKYYDYLGYNTALSYHFADLVIEEISKGKVPDYIETQDYQGIGYYLLQLKRTGEPHLMNIPIVLTLHSPAFYYLDHCRAPFYKLPDFWIGEMERWTMRAADIFISPSRYMAENNKQDIGDKFQAYNYLPNPYQAGDSLANEIETGDIVFFGKLTYQKGILELVKNMAALWDNGFEYPLKVLGDDHFFELYQVNMKDYIIKKFKKYHEAGKIVFEGKLHPSKINDRLSKAHIVIIPSIVDNFPYTVVESMMLGKVLLVSDGGGQCEIIEDGISGFVYKRNDNSSFAQKMAQLLELKKENYEKISANARTRILSLCSYDNVFKAKLDILKTYTNKEITEYPFTKVISQKKVQPSHGFVPNRLSIVVPYYNTGKYVEETIKNIFEIEYPGKEVIIVNDGSDDKDSIKKLKDISGAFDVKIIHQKNMGLPGARNTGAKAATGEFLAFLDADDKVDPYYHARAIKLLKQYNNVSFIGCWAQYFDGDTNCWPTFNPEPPYLLLHNPINSSALVYKRDHFLASGLNDMDMMPAYEDYQSVIHLVQDGFRGIVIPEPLFKYRIHPSSLSRTFNQQIHLDAFRLLTQKHESFFKEHAIDVIHFLQANGPSHLYDNPTFSPHTDVQKLWEKISFLEAENLALKGGNGQSDHYSLSLREADISNLLKENYYHKSQVKIISDWYHREYEVLPLWYKRVGQIIKIITGHRKIFKK